MPYLDTTVLAVPTAAKAEYLAYASELDALFREVGALKVTEAWGDDVPHGKLTDYYRAVQAAEGESIVLGWITWPDKATRDAGWEKAMADPRIQAPAPFDRQRMIFGAFEVVLEV